MKELVSRPDRLSCDAGIAIGPILFIIAILAILAAAIAAGSGSFNAPTATEGSKTKASAIIQLGDNLKMGMDRLTMENGVAFGSWEIDPVNNTTGNMALFSPTGGGISSPSTSLAGNPGNDAWYYPTGAVPEVGSNDQLAVLNVSNDVCNEINNRANGLNSPGTAAALGNFAANGNDASIANWPNQLKGKTVGCVQNSDMSGQYFFYEILSIE